MLAWVAIMTQLSLSLAGTAYEHLMGYKSCPTTIDAVCLKDKVSARPLINLHVMQKVAQGKL